ncbi:hypothetical protein PpBr36_08943 [Pyricularia pennisetigena]|uniref:hypothetical protein n=1 Tax=Pyricularia pennisetigena TaxID=1578925 RepID=UPI0011529FA7|nr:hypothetical protein PpBr36_08943 [Pyricularia pennisetigena]TLS24360.1 hypothetical protein PpBr36_08943 [Pyricularia pennisetigena]
MASESWPYRQKPHASPGRIISLVHQRVDPADPQPARLGAAERLEKDPEGHEMGHLDALVPPGRLLLCQHGQIDGQVRVPGRVVIVVVAAAAAVVHPTRNPSLLLLLLLLLLLVQAQRPHLEDGQVEVGGPRGPDSRQLEFVAPQLGVVLDRVPEDDVGGRVGRGLVRRHGEHAGDVEPLLQGVQGLGGRGPGGGQGGFEVGHGALGEPDGQDAGAEAVGQLGRVDVGDVVRVQQRGDHGRVGGGDGGLERAAELRVHRVLSQARPVWEHLDDLLDYAVRDLRVAVPFLRRLQAQHVEGARVAGPVGQRAEADFAGAVDACQVRDGIQGCKVMLSQEHPQQRDLVRVGGARRGVVRVQLWSGAVCDEQICEVEIPPVDGKAQGSRKTALRMGRNGNAAGDEMFGDGGVARLYGPRTWRAFYRMAEVEERLDNVYISQLDFPAEARTTARVCNDSLSCGGVLVAPSISQDLQRPSKPDLVVGSATHEPALESQGIVARDGTAVRRLQHFVLVPDDGLVNIVIQVALVDGLEKKLEHVRQRQHSSQLQRRPGRRLAASAERVGAVCQEPSNSSVALVQHCTAEGREGDA